MILERNEDYTNKQQSKEKDKIYENVSKNDIDLDESKDDHNLDQSHDDIYLEKRKDDQHLMHRKDDIQTSADLVEEDTDAPPAGIIWTGEEWIRLVFMFVHFTFAILTLLIL